MVGTNLPSSILDQIRDIRRQLAEIRKNKGLSSSSFRGEFEVLHASLGTWLLKIGRGSQDKYFLSIRRDDGTVAFEIGTTVGGQQFWALWDRVPNIVMSDDTVSGQGLARPYIPYPHAHTDWSVMPKTTSTSFVTLDEVRYYKQHPKANMAIRIGSVVGSTGEWRVQQDGVTKASGTIADGVLTVAFATFAVDGSHLASLNLDVQARVTSGPGPVTAHIRDAGGIQS